MRMVRVPNTELNVSEITFGTGIFAKLMVFGETKDQTETVERAIELGINHFDTSPAYGAGASEVNLGRALRGRRDMVVTTKTPVTPEAVLTKTVAQWFRRSVEASLLRLQRDVIDILLLHSVLQFTRAFERPSMAHISMNDYWGDGGVLEAADKLRQEGKVRYFGVAAHENDPRITKAVAASGTITVMNQQFNLVNPSAGFPVAGTGPSQHYSADISGRGEYDQASRYIDFDNVIPFAGSLGIGTLVTSPLGAGVLADKLHEDPEPAYSNPTQTARWRIAHRFHPIAQRHGMPLAELAYRFVLSTPHVVSAIGGFSNKSQVEELAGYAAHGPLSPEVIHDLCRVWTDGHQD